MVCPADGAVGDRDPRRMGGWRSRPPALGRLWSTAATKDAVSARSDLHMSVSLLAFFVVYTAVFGMGYSYMVRLIKKGPQPHESFATESDGRPARPLSAVTTGFGVTVMGIDLSIIWFVIIVFATLMYIVMDGFDDLGIGILFPATPNADDRDVMVNSVAPVWDSSETWLNGSAALFGAFPLAYAVIIDALTIPLTIMLIRLIFRGVAFNFASRPLRRTARSGIRPLLADQLWRPLARHHRRRGHPLGSASLVALVVVRLTGLPRSIFSAVRVL